LLQLADPWAVVAWPASRTAAGRLRAAMALDRRLRGWESAIEMEMEMAAAESCIRNGDRRRTEDPTSTRIQVGRKARLAASPPWYAAVSFPCSLRFRVHDTNGLDRLRVSEMTSSWRRCLLLYPAGHRANECVSWTKPWCALGSS
jgi:hypothetical protein